MISRCYRIFTTPEYDEWLEKQTKKEQYQIEHRIQAIELEGYTVRGSKFDFWAA